MKIAILNYSNHTFLIRNSKYYLFVFNLYAFDDTFARKFKVEKALGQTRYRNWVTVAQDQSFGGQVHLT